MVSPPNLARIPQRYLGPKMTNYPVKKIVMPKDLARVPNGIIPANLLRKIGPTNGQLHHSAATAWNCLKMAAYFDGISLDHVGAYRTFARQTALFKQRYTLTPQSRLITRTWMGETYYLRDGFAPSSSPGMSNHGWGLAIDVKDCSGDRLKWLLAGNAKKFGWWWQVANGPQAEAWHLQFVCGDKPSRGIRQAVKVFPELDA